MAKLNELYDENMWDWLIFQIENKGDYLYKEEYGYESNNWAFDEENHVPANVLLIKYKEKYYVYIGYMENDYYDVPDVFDELEPAYECFKSLIHTGIPSGKKQIENCKKQLIEPDLIDIQCEATYSDPIYFRVYYGGNLLIEHLAGLYVDEINAAIKEYKNFCKRYNTQILKISKIYQWDTNQSYYKINFSNEEEMFVRIPSELHSKKRTIVGLIKMENVQKAI